MENQKCLFTSEASRTASILEKAKDYKNQGFGLKMSLGLSLRRFK